jgi:hypothetical protein
VGVELGRHRARAWSAKGAAYLKAEEDDRQEDASSASRGAGRVGRQLEEGETDGEGDCHNDQVSYAKTMVRVLGGPTH